MCCLKYENDNYEMAKKELPDIGESIVVQYGKGRVVGLNILERLVQIELFEQERVIEYTLDELIKEGAIASQATN
jgi:cell fate regulator YaaT (PSP1 superfamily)